MINNLKKVKENMADHLVSKPWSYIENMSHELNKTVLGKKWKRLNYLSDYDSDRYDIHCYKNKFNVVFLTRPEEKEQKEY